MQSLGRFRTTMRAVPMWARAGNGHVHILRNEGTVAAETIAVQLLPRGAVRRIDAPDPGYCPF
jgi:hypothetical protein